MSKKYNVIFQKTKEGKSIAFTVDREFTKRRITVSAAEELVLDGKAKIVTQDQIPEVYRIY